MKWKILSRFLLKKSESNKEMEDNREKFEEEKYSANWQDFKYFKSKKL